MFSFLSSHLGDVSGYQQQFLAEGVLVIPDFLPQSLLSLMWEEANALQDEAFYKPVSGNAYLKEADKQLPKTHALNLEETTTVGVLAYDQLPKNSMLRALYCDGTFHQLIEAIVNKGPLYRYDCDLGAINIAVMRPGDYLRWHFDQSDFVVSIPLQPASKGGEYQYIKNIKSENDEAYEKVKAVVLGHDTAYETLSTPPGSLIFFEGRHTLHRVSKIEGDAVRIVALLGYADRPNVKSDAYLRRIRYGR